MTTPSGQISLGDVNTELGRSSTFGPVSMDDNYVRNLAGFPRYGDDDYLVADSYGMDSLRSKTWQYSAILQTGGYEPVSGTTEATPVNNYYKRYKIVAIYTKAELNAAGWTGARKIGFVGIYVYSIPNNQPFPNYIVGLMNTTATSGDLTAAYTSRTAQNESFAVSGGTTLNGIVLTTPFIWTGEYNLGIIWAWGATSNWSSTGRIIKMSTGSTTYAATDDAGTYTITSSATQSNSGRPKVYLAPD